MGKKQYVVIGLGRFGRAVCETLYENGAEVLQKFFGKAEPEFLAFISGPSRTADIERVLTLGVHGPLYLHAVLIND